MGTTGTVDRPNEMKHRSLRDQVSLMKTALIRPTGFGTTGAIVVAAVICTTTWTGQAGAKEIAPRSEFAYAKMSDGVKIALAISYPRGFDAQDAVAKWPALVTMSGYRGEVGPLDPGVVDHKYVCVKVSQRGTGASSGVFSLFEPRIATDGYEVIENWIVKQTWSNGRVAMFGHSWSGLNAIQVAATRPPSLRAVMASAVFDDFYRGIARPGGIANVGFPFDWLNQTFGPEGVHGSDDEARQIRLPQDPFVSRQQSSRPARTFAAGAMWKSLTLEEDDAWWQHRALAAKAKQICAPIIMLQAYQDEQTGPRGLRVWEQIPDDVPKHLILTNGKHRTLESFFGIAKDWMDCFVNGDGTDCKRGLGNEQERVWAFFETERRADGRASRINKPWKSSDFPLPETRWTTWYLQADGTISKAPTVNLRERSYRVRRNVADKDLDRTRFVIEFDQATAICGPILLTLWATCSSIETDFYALLVDEDSKGRRRFLQRGLLRASHRDVDDDLSDWASTDSGRFIVRPHHSHQNPQPLVPFEPTEFLVEIFAVGHVFRPGHRLVLEIGQPPAGDLVNLDRGGNVSYAYASDPPDAEVDVLCGGEHASRLLLPVLPSLPPVDEESPEPGKVAGVYFESGA